VTDAVDADELRLYKLGVGSVLRVVIVEIDVVRIMDVMVVMMLVSVVGCPKRVDVLVTVAT
jgi:hypothetical protein